jgi:hypothetical protein
MKHKLEEISGMIEQYRQRQDGKEPIEYALVDAFHGPLTGINEYLELISRIDDDTCTRVACAGKRLIRDAYAEIEQMCLIIEAALGEVRILYGGGPFDGARDIVDVVIKDKYVVPKGAGDDVSGSREGRLNG